MIRLAAITKENFYDILDLKRPEHETFVATNAVSLAEAWLYRDKQTVNPRAIYDDSTLVGFVMTQTDVEQRTLDIWRILFPEQYVNRGYGTQLLNLLISEAKQIPDLDRIQLSYVPGNDLAEHVYMKAGFVATGEIEDGEIVMECVL